MARLSSLLFCLFFAPPNASAKEASEKAFIGGTFGADFMLKNFEVSKIKTKNGSGDRLTLSMSDIQGRKLKGPPTYFHVQVQNDSKRLIVDLSSTPRSALTEEAMISELKKTKFIRGGRMLLDPLDNTMTLIFDLKSSVRVKTWQVAGNKDNSKIVVDIWK
ncbi:MAG: hypothetical protein N2578_04720 [Bdellovibrionaceae bacterium]|nr:hypothetical protein [Pseudobdellovibrionaceae bacterium]